MKEKGYVAKQTGRLPFLRCSRCCCAPAGRAGRPRRAAAGRLRWNPGPRRMGTSGSSRPCRARTASLTAGQGRTGSTSSTLKRARMAPATSCTSTMPPCARPISAPGPAAPTTARTAPAMCLPRRAALCPVSLAKTCCLSFRARCTARGTQPFCPTSSGWTLTAATARQSSPSRPTRCCASRS